MDATQKWRIFVIVRKANWKYQHGMSTCLSWSWKDTILHKCIMLFSNWMQNFITSSIMSSEHWNTKTKKSLKRYCQLSIKFLAELYCEKWMSWKWHSSPSVDLCFNWITLICHIIKIITTYKLICICMFFSLFKIYY